MHIKLRSFYILIPALHKWFLATHTFIQINRADGLDLISVTDTKPKALQELLSTVHNIWDP